MPKTLKKQRLSKADKSMIRAVQEMADHRRGKITLPARVVKVPEHVDVTRIRKKLGYNQKEFADHFGFTVGAIRDWEQGRRKPERSARILLTLIATHPKTVERTLSSI